MGLTVYGIPNCDSCRKARKWLEQHEIAYRFHDLREEGVDERMLKRWQRKLDWQDILNTRSRTWRELSERARKNLDADRAMALLQKHPTLIKRPVFEAGNAIDVGFAPARLKAFLKEIK